MPSLSIDNTNSTDTVLNVGGVESLRLRAGGITSFNGGQLAGTRRRNVNGGCEIAQGGTSFAAVTSGSWTLDGYAWGQSSEAVVTIAQVSDTPSDNEFQFSHRVTVTTADTSIAASQFAIVITKIEGYDARDFIGRPFVFSFRVRSPKTGIHCVSFRNTGADRSYVAEYTVTAANTWETKFVSVPVGLLTAGTWNWGNGTGIDIAFALACGTTYQTTAGAWQTGNYLATANQVNCLDAVSNIFAITGVQIEPGLIPTPFEHRVIMQELAHAQRYYQTSYYIWSGAMTVGNTYYLSQPFAVHMRANPTITFSNSSNSGFGSPVLGLVSTSVVRIDSTASATGIGYFQGNWTAQSRIT